MIDALTEQITCIKAMIERKNARRIIVSDSTDSVSVLLTDAGDEYDDSVFDGSTLDSSITSDAEEVGSPDFVSGAEEVDTDPRPLPGMATGTPGHDTGVCLENRPQG